MTAFRRSESGEASTGTSLLRWCGVAVLLLLPVGTATAGDEHPDALTLSGLQGLYDLKTDAMPAGHGGGFTLISEVLEIDADALTFAPTYAGAGEYSLSGNTLTIVDGSGFVDVVEAMLSDGGNVLTLVDDIYGTLETFVFTRRSGTGTSNAVTVATLQGTYDLDAGRSALQNFAHLVWGELDIAGDTLATSLTFSQTSALALDGNTVTLTHADGRITPLRASLGEDGTVLTLVFVEAGDTFVYERR